MNDKVRTFRDFLPRPLIEDIREFSHDQPTCRTNLTSWSADVTGTSGAILLFDLSEELTIRIRDAVLHKSSLLTKLADKYWNATYTLGSRYSYLPWHNDGSHIVAITVYLNEVWSHNWGGFFVYTENQEPEKSLDDWKAILPQYNNAIMLEPPLWHTTTMPTIDAPLRESLQIFIDEENKGNGYK